MHILLLLTIFMTPTLMITMCNLNKIIFKQVNMKKYTINLVG